MALFPLQITNAAVVQDFRIVLETKMYFYGSLKFRSLK